MNIMGYVFQNTQTSKKTVYTLFHSLIVTETAELNYI